MWVRQCTQCSSPISAMSVIKALLSSSKFAQGQRPWFAGVDLAALVAFL